jgi:hypothetical protein
MKSETVSAKGNRNAFVENRDRGGRGEGGEIEARRTRGLDLRRREQLNVKMSAWPPRSYCVWSVAPIGETRVPVSQGYSCRMHLSCISSLPRVLTGRSLRHRIRVGSPDFSYGWKDAQRIL